MKTTKENVIAQIQDSISSIFSKQDVINLINSIEDKNRITVTDIGAAIDKLVDSLERNSQDVIDLTNVEFSINYDNKIQVDSIGLDFDYIREALENTFMDFGEVDNSNED